MWLTKRLSEETGTDRVRRGTVTAGGDAPVVLADTEYREPESVTPYGLSSKMPEGARAAMLGGLCLGCCEAPGEGLEDGELRLYSAGGAEILLKNSGEVFINGQRFAPKP